MGDLAMSIISFQPQPLSNTADVYRSHEPNTDYRAGPGGSLLHEGGGPEHRSEPTTIGTNGSQTREVWSDHNHCPAHQPAERGESFQPMWDFTGHSNSAPTTHPYRSSASVLYHPEQQPTTLFRSSKALDSGPRATFTNAQESGPSSVNDRPYGDPWASRLLAETNTDEGPKTGHELPNSIHGNSASSSPADTRQPANGPDSSSDNPVATDLSTASIATTELEKSYMFDSSGGHLQPNIDIQQFIKQDVFAGVSDSVTVLRKIKHPQPRNLGFGRFGKVKGKGKKAWNLDLDLDTVKSVIQKDAEVVHDDYLGLYTLSEDHSPTAFSDIQTLLEPNSVEIDITPSPLVQAEPNYFKITPCHPTSETFAQRKNKHTASSIYARLVQAFRGPLKLQ